MPNMTLIQAVTVGSGGAANIEFTSIPQTYTDLIVKVTARSSGADTSIELSFNNNTANRNAIYLFGNGTSASSGNDTKMYITSSIVPSTSTASTFSNAELYIPNYAGSNGKSSSVDGVSENNATASNLGITANLWNNTAAITSIQLTPANSGNFVQYSTAYLYGVSSAAVSAKATGGNLVVTDGTYWYHSFTSSGTFTPTSALTADVLLVAGGGGGGYDQYSGGRGAGGGGAGGLLALTSQSLSATAYTVTVGAGGTSASLGSSGSGTNSTFQTLTAAVGGGGGGGNNTGGGSDDGGNGGSGGGAASAATVGTGVSGQGFAGGNNTGSNYAGGGGGGATEVGKQGPDAGGSGIGGAGSNAYSTWASITNTGAGGYYAGGGGGQNQSGGSDGGLGGGGHGATGGTSNSGVTAGTARTGGGGGGGRPGGTGGSGVIIVRYAV